MNFWTKRNAVKMFDTELCFTAQNRFLRNWNFTNTETLYLNFFFVFLDKRFVSRETNGKRRKKKRRIEQINAMRNEMDLTITADMAKGLVLRCTTAIGGFRIRKRHCCRNAISVVNADFFLWKFVKADLRMENGEKWERENRWKNWRGKGKEESARESRYAYTFAPSILPIYIRL